MMLRFKRLGLAGAFLFLAMAGGAVGPALIGAALAQVSGQAGLLISGLGVTVFNYLPLASGQIAIGAGASNNPTAVSLSGDCTMSGSGVVTCLKTNGTALGTAATANTGASGSAVPILNVANTWAAGALQSFAGHVASSGAAPVLSSCGTSPAVTGDDKDAVVTMGTGTPTGCVITFNAAYTSAPLCTVAWQATPLASQSYAVSNTAITLTQTATSSNKVNYHCAAPAGG